MDCLVVLLLSLWTPLCLKHGMSCSGSFPLLPITVFVYLQNPECFVDDCNFHISNPICRSIFKPSHFLFMSVWQTCFFFFPRDIYFCQVHLHSLESNTQECFSSFSLVSSLTASLPSNDTFYQSKVFSISLPGF